MLSTKITTHDEAVDIVEEEVQEDIELMAGLTGHAEEEDHDLATTPVWRQFRRRAPVLCLLALFGVVTASVIGQDYPGNNVDAEPPRIFWWESDAYRPYFSEWIKRPEYTSRLKRYLGAQQKKKQP